MVGDTQSTVVIFSGCMRIFWYIITRPTHTHGHSTVYIIRHIFRATLAH